MSRVAVFVFLGFVVLGGAGCSTKILASDYDQHCAHSSDCEIVAVGDVCAVCGGEFGAVNIGAFAQVGADFSRERAFCGPTVLAECGATAPTNRPICEGTTCVIPASGTACVSTAACTGEP